MAIVGAATVLVFAAMAGAAGDVARVDVVEDTADRLVLSLTVDDYTTSIVDIDGQVYQTLQIADEPLGKVVGAPELPRVCRSVAIGGDALMVARVREARYEDIGSIDIAPSKGNFSRNILPKDVPYSFGPEYAIDAFYPAEVVTLGEPYLLRRQRGVVVTFNPFRYNPVSRTLRVCREITVELVRVGVDTRNVLSGGERGVETSLAFHQILNRHFLNYAAPSRYTPLEETGSMLIIAHDAWIANVQPLAAHHNANGIPTTVVGVSTIGNNATAIKAYIQNRYNTTDLVFVLLVGDSTQVATPSASGGASDPSYAKLSGTDSYPDILVGRFSAESAAQVDTQVARTLYYEQTPVYDQPWYKRAMGVASTEGPGDDGEYDNQHMDNIRTDLLAYGYTPVDQFYGGGATISQLSASLNAGRGLINYTGHGSTTAWSTSGFSNTSVNSLTNVNMLPFIFDVACVNGEFNGYTCFAEAWLRASYNGQPTGAIGIYASSINQSWDPPMCAQDACVDLLVAEGYVSFGALCFAGSCQMMDEYGAGGTAMYDTWHVFGDPALKVRFDGPYAPQTSNVYLQIDRNTPVTIQLTGSDRDGDPLDFIVSSLPAHGALSDPAGPAITAVPYTLLAKGRTLRYTPASDYIGTDAFLFKANDGTPPPDGGDSNLSSVNVIVQALQPQIMTTELPVGTVNTEYGPVQLACDEGQPPLVWQIITDLPYVEQDLGMNGFAEVGVAQDWKDDDKRWDYTLPFAFPFYDQLYTKVYVWTNGMIDFVVPHVGSSPANTDTLLKSNRRIAALWDDLITTGSGDDIFIDASVPGAVTFRWKAHTYAGNQPVNVAMTLHDSGAIDFHYGSGNRGTVTSPLTPTIGVSEGDDTHYTLSTYNKSADLAWANSLRLAIPAQISPGLHLSQAGELSGTPLEAGSFLPVIRVTDSLGRTDQAVIPLAVTTFAAGDCDFNQDGLVDLLDFAAFQRCFTGAGNGPVLSECLIFRADADDDIDMSDFVRFGEMLDD